MSRKALGRSGHGHPHLVGRTCDDPAVLRIGAALERERPRPLDAELG